MKKHIKFALLNLILSLAGLASPELARGQFLGNVSLTTVSQILAPNGTTCTGSQQTFVVVNLGQPEHLATASSAAASFTMEIDGVDALSNIYKISNPLVGVATNKFLVQANGYMPIVEVNVTCTLAATFSLTYSGSFAANPIANVSSPGSSSSSSSSTSGNVQGVISAGSNGNPVFPIVDGALQPPINASFQSLGVDNFSAQSLAVPNSNSSVTTVSFLPPAAAAGEWGLAFFGPPSGTINTFNGPWTCVGLPCTQTTNPSIAQLSLQPSSTNALSVTETNPQSTNPAYFNAIFVSFKQAPAVRQTNQGNFTASVATTGNTLAGSTLVVAVQCAGTPCVMNSMTDTQGNTWKQVAFVQNTGATNGGGMSVWMAGPSSAAAETVTFSAAPGTTLSGSAIVELNGIIPGTLVTPLAAVTTANPKLIRQENDNGGIFTETGGFSATDTITLSGAGTTLVSMWQQLQNGVFSSCQLTLRVTAASGTTPTLNTYVQDSGDNVGFNDRLSMVQATAAGNQLGAIPMLTATSLAAVASSAVASTDGSLAAGSSVPGPLGPFGRIKFVVGGTSPSFTITYSLVCK